MYCELYKGGDGEELEVDDNIGEEWFVMIFGGF